MTKARTLADNFAADINGITAGTGITGGGTSGTVTITNDMATTIDAKGDLVVGTGADTYSRLATGNNGETLVADSSASTGLRWQGNFAAGKNAIINGDFRIWQRGTSFSPTSGAWTFCSDRYQVYNTFSAGTFTASQQTFTPGTAPVSGYEGQFFLRLTAATTGTSNVNVKQLVEDVRTFAGQTVTFSFWAKASANRSVDIFIRQNFGSGGSASVDSSPATVTVTTAWQRFSYTVTLGSMSGKTIGTGSSLEIWPATSTNFTGGTTLDFWGWQLESGNVATAFQTATGTLAGELAACQRYYYRLGNDNTAVNRSICSGAAYASNDASGVVQFPTTMRTTPTLDATSGTNYYGFLANSATDGFNSFTLGYADRTSAIIYNASQIAQTAGHGGVFITQNASASVAFSSEL